VKKRNEVTTMTAKFSQEIAQQIGRRITNLLIEHDKTQQQLADALGLNKSTISAWVHGKRMPKLSSVDAMCRFFHVERSAILGDNGVDPQISDQMKNEINRLVDERIQSQSTDVRTDGQSPEYYADSTVRRITEVMRTNPDSRVIFDAMTTLKSEDLKLIAKIIEKMSD
jgi:transcriptional regulator with XRE-family HTH domain